MNYKALLFSLLTLTLFDTSNIFTMKRPLEDVYPDELSEEIYFEQTEALALAQLLPNDLLGIIFCYALDCDKIEDITLLNLVCKHWRHYFLHENQDIRKARLDLFIAQDYRSLFEIPNIKYQPNVFLKTKQYNVVAAMINFNRITPSIRIESIDQLENNFYEGNSFFFIKKITDETAETLYLPILFAIEFKTFDPQELSNRGNNLLKIAENAIVVQKNNTEKAFQEMIELARHYRVDKNSKPEIVFFGFDF